MKNLFTESLKQKSAEAFTFVSDKLLHEKTNLVYDFSLDCDEGFPTPQEIAEGFPNPCGYDTGMEDGLINGATFLSACLTRLREHDDENEAKKLKALAHRLVLGMLQTALSAKESGFLPRAVCPSDGKSHYTDSSIDQYTMFTYGAYIYLKSGLCTKEEHALYAKILSNISGRAKRNITKENGYDMCREDGGSSKVTKFWGEKGFEFALYCRLPMIYLTTYEFTGENRWLEEYKALRDQAIEGTRPFSRPWHVYVLQQMQSALFVLKSLDPEEKYRKIYEDLSREVAEFAISLTDSIKERLAQKTDFNEPSIPFRERPLREIPNPAWGGLKQFYTKRGDDNDTFFLMQDAANIVLCATMGGVAVPEDAADLFANTWKKIDYSRQTRCVSVHYLCAYYAFQERGKMQVLE